MASVPNDFGRTIFALFDPTALGAREDDDASERLESWEEALVRMATTFEEPRAEVGEELLHDEKYAADWVARWARAAIDLVALSERTPIMAVVRLITPSATGER